MAYNTTPTSSVEDVRSKYAQYFESDTSSSVVSVETFFQLLLAEMTNQDPLEPTSNTEFVSQLANFTALQNSSDSLYYNTVSYAASLAGKTVTIATRSTVTNADGSVGIDIVTGVVTGVDISDENSVELTVNGNRYPLSSVMNVAGNATGSTVSATDGAYAVSLIGKNVMLLATNSDGQSIIDSGVVDSIEVENGAYRIVMNGLSYPLDSVIKVGNTASSIGAEESGSSGTTADNSTGAADNAAATAAAQTLAETKPVEDDVQTAGDSETETSILGVGTSEDEELKELFS